MVFSQGTIPRNDKSEFEEEEKYLDKEVSSIQGKG